MFGHEIVTSLHILVLGPCMFNDVFIAYIFPVSSFEKTLSQVALNELRVDGWMDGRAEGQAHREIR
jgi:hypothetical protein